MKIQHRQLLRLQVETKSGTPLGLVQSFAVDTETQGIACYYVKPSPFAKPFADTLLIPPAQVLSISKEKMIVEDAIVPGMVVAGAPTGSVV
ncbi:hypothetical protein COV04_03110 [Candidatus Uhrbacteria bacterium CG10_big_fil_rev_8_21_14_0_10_48_11]|uniref:PRC-barrel domain-containing protein n=1 Tax=Candidatus Uhrbacteria bacterium CG10_big_fil_rev_8_21_14_0_10_48_11 TaxID=1975037 RepID=A0A2M8LE51_9BACT|nr:MAG: hypothetical protein COV04_03110 [Candidatus Uhrbacteria bacterium CG10_big_fil_rev_8_21_14_0_10_48_11]